MSWETQGRQDHGWFGHGAEAVSRNAAVSDKASMLAVGAVSTRIRAVVHGAVAALPVRSRDHAAIRTDPAAVDRLSGLMAAWSKAGALDKTRFAAGFFNRSADDPVVEKLRAAAVAAATARTDAELRAASMTLAQAQQQVGLDRWSRFVEDARQRADRFAERSPGVIAALKSGMDMVLRQVGKLNPIGTAQAQRGGSGGRDTPSGWAAERSARKPQDTSLQYRRGAYTSVEPSIRHVDETRFRTEPGSA